MIFLRRIIKIKIDMISEKLTFAYRRTRARFGGGIY
jgi:hypothetical protein